MPRESYAATVARSTAVLEEIFMHVLEQLPPGERTNLLRPWNIHMHEIQRATQLRIERSDYEAYRRSGIEVAGHTLSAQATRAGL